MARVRPLYLPQDLLKTASDLDFSNQVEAGLSNLRFPQTVEEGIRGLRSIAFGDPDATEWTPTPMKAPTPLPIVVSPQPEVRQQQQAQPGPTPNAPTSTADASLPSATVVSAPAGEAGVASPASPSPIASGPGRGFYRGDGNTEAADPGIYRGSADERIDPGIYRPGYAPSSGTGAEGVERWSSLVAEAARQYNLPEATIKGLMEIESGGDPEAVSKAGAQGLMQVMPFHFKPGENPRDPRTNIFRGAKVYADALARYGDPDKAAAAYFGAIDDQGNITNATDGSSVNGPTYVRLWRQAAAKYGGGTSSGSGTATPTPDRGAGTVVPAPAPPLTAGPIPAAPSSPPAAAASVPASPAAGGSPDLVTIQHEDGRRLTVPRANLPGYLRSAAPGVPPTWRVVEDARQAMGAPGDAGDMPRLSLGQPEDDILPGSGVERDPRRFIPTPSIEPLGPALRGEDALTDPRFITQRGEQSVIRPDGEVYGGVTPSQTWLPPGTRNRAVPGEVFEYTAPSAPQIVGPVDPAEPNRAVPGAVDESGTGTRDPFGRYPNLMGDQALYRAPLLPTDPEATTGAEYDPRDADQGAREWRPSAADVAPTGAAPSSITPPTARATSASGSTFASSGASGDEYRDDSGPREALPGSVGAGPVGPLYGPPQTTAIGAVENARAGLADQEELAPRPGIVERATAPAANVYGPAIAEATQTQDEIAARNREKFGELAQAAAVPLETINRAVSIANAVLLATPQATADTIDAALSAVGLDRQNIGIDLPVVGRVGVADIIDVGPFTAIGMGRASAAFPSRGIAAGIEHAAGAGIAAAGRGIRAVGANVGEALERNAANVAAADDGVRMLGSGMVPEGPRARLTPPDPVQPLNISSASDVVNEIRQTGLLPAARVVEMIGERPEYLPAVAQTILEQRRKVVDGTMTVRDVAKAYYMTVASQGSDAKSVAMVEGKVPGFRIPEQFWAVERSADGRPMVRPEEAAAAWLFSPRGQQALDDLERGVLNREAWAEGAAVRRAYGDDRFRTTNVFSERAPVDGRTKFNMTTLQAFTDGFNDLGRRVAAGEAPVHMLDRYTMRLNGVREAKVPFIRHALGFGDSPTADAVEINTWLTGVADSRHLQTREAQLVKSINEWLRDPRVGAEMRDQITRRFAEVRDLLPPEATADLPPEVFNHVLHHWIWDRMKGISTTHEGFYDALRRASGFIPGASTLRNASQGALVGAASEDLQAQQEGREADPTGRLVRGVMGAGLGVLAGNRAARQGVMRATRAAGSGMVPAGGQPTVEVLQQRLVQARGIVDRLRSVGDPERLARAQDNLAAIESQLVDARNARRDLEPRITSDVGRRIESLPLDERSADDFSVVGRERVRGMPSDLSGPVGIPVDTGPQLRGSGFVPDEPRPSGLGNVPPSKVREPALPGMDPPPTRIEYAGNPDVSEAPNRPRLPGELPAGRQPEMFDRGEYVPPLERSVAPAMSSPAPIPSRTLREELPNILRSLNEPPRITVGPDDVLTPAERIAAGQMPLEEATTGPVRRFVQTISKAVAPWSNRVSILRYAGMLSDTAGQTMNAATNLLLQGVDVAATPVAAALDVGRVAGARAMGRQAEREVFFSEFGARLAGMRAGASVGLRAAWDVLRTGLKPGEAEKLEQARGFASGSGIVDFAAEAPLRLMGAADAYFRTMAAGGHLMAEARAAATKANGGKAPTEAMIREAAKDPALLARVQEMAAKSVLQEDRALTTAYRRLIKDLDPTTRAIVSTEVPFVRTPYNIVAQGMEMSPAGLAAVARDITAGKAPREVEHKLARVMIGTAVMGAAVADYGAGNLTGPYPTDEKTRSTLPPGWRPWSRKVEVGGATYYIPLAYLGPLALPPVMAILAGETAKKGSAALSPDWAGKVALGIGAYAAQATFFEGFSEMAKVFESPDRQLERHVEGLAAQFSPHILGGGALGREIQRIMGMPARDPEGAMEALLATFPYAANRVEPRQDVLGRPQSMGIGGPAGAVIRGGKENDASVIRAFRKAGEGLPTQAPKQIRDPEAERMRTLTPAQRHRWRRVFGSELQAGYADEGRPTDTETLRKVEERARTAANETILGRR